MATADNSLTREESLACLGGIWNFFLREILSHAEAEQELVNSINRGELALRAYERMAFHNQKIDDAEQAMAIIRMLRRRVDTTLRDY